MIGRPADAQGEEARAQVGGGSFSTWGPGSGPGASLGRPGAIPVLASPFGSNATSSGHCCISRIQPVPRRRRSPRDPAKCPRGGNQSMFPPSRETVPTKDEGGQEWEEQEVALQRSSWRCPALTMARQLIHLLCTPHSTPGPPLLYSPPCLLSAVQ